MKTDDATFLSDVIAAFAVESGIRDIASDVVKIIARSLAPRVAFIALAKSDGSSDVLASHGLGASDFRRLETRVIKSTVWKIFSLRQPIAVDDLSADAAMSFISFATGAKFLVAVPIDLNDKTVGLVAVAFDRTARVNEPRVIELLNSVAALASQSLRIARNATENSQRIADERVTAVQELKGKYGFGSLVGNASQMRAVYDQVTQVARSNAGVMLRGEVGTGKETIASVIHYNSLRSKRSFHVVNCAAFSANLVDQELFGGNRRGRFEQIDGGTIYLDEIADLPQETQAKLLDVITNREFTRGDEQVPVNVRLISASARDLETLVADGNFNGELFEKLSLFTAFVPPLRERKSDILLLAENFVDSIGRKHKKHILRISTPAIDMLTAYHFPGNVRELENVIEHAVVHCDSNVIHGHHLPPTLQTAEQSGTETRVTLANAVEAFERDLISDTLKSTRGNVAQAAVMLDSTERILGYKVRKYNIFPKRFR